MFFLIHITGKQHPRYLFPGDSPILLHWLIRTKYTRNFSNELGGLTN